MGSLTIGGEEKVCGVLLRQPSDLIDLLLDLQTLKVVKLGLMALEGAVDIVLSLREWLSLALQKENEGNGMWEEKRARVQMYYRAMQHPKPDSVTFPLIMWRNIIVSMDSAQLQIIY